MSGQMTAVATLDAPDTVIDGAMDPCSCAGSVSATSVLGVQRLLVVASSRSGV